MNRVTVFAGPAVFLVLGPLLSVAAAQVPPIERVNLTPGRVFQVNGEPFFPLMAWLQDAANFPAARECGMNTTAGYWTGSSGTKDVVEYQALVAEAGLYGVMPFDPRLKGHPQLLGYIHLFAVNYDERAMAAEATITVPGLAAGAEIEVLDEGRVLRAEAGGFRDAFKPLAVHLYRVQGSGWASGAHTAGSSANSAFWDMFRSFSVPLQPAANKVRKYF
jgi:hypothetical protein